eukprot:XP_019918176.1 PREDICTED: uncharacterized protein LOC105317207 [Crassostrea gigas]
MKWVLSKGDDNITQALTLAENLPSVQSVIPSLRLPKMRFTKTGSCLQMNYRSRGIRLNISTDKQNLTSLSSSDEWKFIKVNIDYSTESYQITMTPISTTSSVEISIKDIHILNTPCEDCFACFDDGSCIESGKLCDMSIDCPDKSDELNCALECYNEKYYRGFRAKTKFLHQCIDGTCKLDSQSKGKPGCSIFSGQKWEECSVPQCKIESLECDFERNMCNWKFSKQGVKWNRHKSEDVDDIVVTAKLDKTLTRNEEDMAILYSTPQPVSSDFGCLTLSYKGKGVHLQLFITQGTIYTRNKMVFERRDVDSKLFASTSIQTPTNIPYMVILVGTFKANRSGIIQIGKISYENGICADKEPCSFTQFQCEDGSCIPVGEFCNGLTNCPNQEDESPCKHNNNTSCLEYNSGCSKRCPAHCQCNGFIFKCSSPENVTKEVRVLDLSSNSFNIESIEDFGLLVHLNLSSCHLSDSSLTDLGIRLNSFSLQNLDLSYNNIKNLESKAFDGLSNLLYLNISYNQIIRFQMDFLKFTPKLRHLIIINNKIAKITALESYNRLNSSLELLDLQNNNLMTIQPRSLYWLRSVSKIILRNNNITNTDFYFSTSMKMLYELDLSYNLIQNITDYMFNGLDRLRYLNLQNNLIVILDGFSFSNLNSLRTLNLAFNQIHTINRMAFENLVSLTKLNLTGNKLKSLAPTRFVALAKLTIFDLSGNGLENLEYDAFKGLESVKYVHINNNKLTVSRTMFQGLCNLEWLQTDSYIICCAKPLTVDSSKCISPKDSISSCEQLINVGFLAQMIWYMALFSVIGNAYVIYYRIQGRIKGNASQGVFVLHLSVSDFLMGMYLFIIAIADLEYRNIYGFNDGEWRYSTTCTIAGLLATTSSEASVIFIFLITIERYIVLKHPFSAGLVKKRRLILFVTLVAWLIAILFSVVPNLVYSDFYSRSTVCISLPLTPGKVSGWEYSTFLFIGFNMFIFMAIVIGQMLIYIQVKRMGKKIENDNSKREMAVFKSLSYVVLSDTFCWIPIIVIGLLASGGVNISSDVYAWVIVLILPINSALNPFIYTFSMIYRKYYDLYDYYPNISIINCKQTGKGLEYRGTISVTIYGKTCQRWDSQTPHAHTYDKDLPGNASVHENYCRNPRASDETVPWCYTTDKNIRWQYCGVPYCEVDFSKCKLTSEGLDYRGNVSRTASGKTCQRWDKQYPWTHTYTDLYGGNSVHENYCRNPKAGQDPSPWCFTTDDKVQWELCDIPVCECRDTQKGEAYIGKTSQTVDGRQCVRWDSVDDSHPDYFNVKFLTGSKSTHENYCRNPDNKIAPWCFTELVGGSWNYCNIPFCKRSSAECLTSPKGFDYFGTENRTVDNIDCQRWDTVKPHQHSFSKGFMGLSASEHENYCRNPDDDKLPWCYTVNSKIKFQYCNIPNCPERDCKITEIGINYRGKQRTTRGGILCQRWDRTYPHIPNPSISFAASSLSAQENYCRNPDREPAPWCYTMNPTVRWQLCDVPFCFNGK